jgi:hypothetical protein
MQLFAHGLQLPVAPLRLPLDVTLEGTYSPQDIFFRTFNLASDRVSLGGFLLLGQNFTELQALTLSLDGVPRISGTLFLPFSLARWRDTRSLFDALDESQKFDVDLAVDGLDLKQFANALGEQPPATGMLYGKVAAFGPMPSLQLTLSAQLENLGPSAKPNAIKCQTHYANGRADLDVTATFGVSAPLTLKAWLPLLLNKSSLAAGNLLDRAEQLFLKIDCPALFLETLPNDWRWKADHGLVSGSVSFSNTALAPTISGTAQIMNAQLPLSPWPELRDLEAEIYFANTEAFVDPLRFRVNSNTISLRGRFTANTSTFSLTLLPVEPAIALLDPPKSGTKLAGLRILEEETSVGDQRLREIFLRGGLNSGVASLTISSESDQSASPSQATYFLSSQDGSASSLLLRPVAPERAFDFPSGPVRTKSLFR